MEGCEQEYRCHHDATLLQTGHTPDTSPHCMTKHKTICSECAQKANVVSRSLHFVNRMVFLCRGKTPHSGSYPHVFGVARWQAPHTRFAVLCHGLFQVIYITMPSSCCAVGCTNRWCKVCSVKLYRIPLPSDRRSMWVTAIQRKQWTPNDYSRLCSDHFCTG